MLIKSFAVLLTQVVGRKESERVFGALDGGYVTYQAAVSCCLDVSCHVCPRADRGWATGTPGLWAFGLRVG